MAKMPVERMKTFGVRLVVTVVSVMGVTVTMPAAAQDDLATLLPGLNLDAPPAVFDPDDLIIFYGGVGYLNKQAQPALAEIIETQTGGKSGGATSLAMSAFQLVDGRAHSLSSYPVVTGDPSLKVALSESLAISKDQIDGATIAGQLADETNLVLSVIGAFEAYVPLVKETSQGAFAEKHYITSVTAILSQAGTGRVLLAAPALSEMVVREEHKSGGETRAVYLNRFAKAYEAAVKDAVDSLWRMSTELSGDYPEMDVVTTVAVKDPATRKLFGMKASASGDLCQGGSSCRDDDQICHAMAGLLAQGVTEKIANSGRATLPPASWAAWGESARDQLKINASVLRINSAGGLRQLDDQLTLVLAPAYADRKVQVTLTGILQKDVDGQSKYLSYRGYKAFLKADWSAAPGSCSPEMREASGTYAYVKDATPVSQVRNASDKGVPPAIEYQQGYGIVAVLNALQAMAHHVQ